MYVYKCVSVSVSIYIYVYVLPILYVEWQNRRARDNPYTAQYPLQNTMGGVE